MQWLEQFDTWVWTEDNLPHHLSELYNNTIPPIIKGKNPAELHGHQSRLFNGPWLRENCKPFKLEVSLGNYNLCITYNIVMWRDQRLGLYHSPNF